MRFGTRKRWRIGRLPNVSDETWRTIWLIVLVVSAILGLGRAVQTHARQDRIRSFTGDPAPVAHGVTTRTEALPAAPDDQTGTIDLIQDVWGEHWPLAAAIAECESALRADAVNTANADGSEDVGLFQINSIHGRSRDELLDPVANTRFAYTLFQTYGIAPWESSRLCWEGEVPRTNQ